MILQTPKVCHANSLYAGTRVATREPERNDRMSDGRQSTSTGSGVVQSGIARGRSGSGRDQVGLVLPSVAPYRPRAGE